MARAVTDDIYRPGYVVTEQRSQPVQTTVQVTTNATRSAPPPAAGLPPHQNAPPRPMPPQPVPPRPSAAPKAKIMVRSHVILQPHPLPCICLLVTCMYCYKICSDRSVYIFVCQCACVYRCRAHSKKFKNTTTKFLTNM